MFCERSHVNDRDTDIFTESGDVLFVLQRSELGERFYHDCFQICLKTEGYVCELIKTILISVIMVSDYFHLKWNNYLCYCC